jgi:outer membrane protein assembly factor BamE
MRFALYALLALSVAGCSLVYRLPTRQGNIIEQKQLELLRTGQTRDQVKFLLGTPLATSPFRTDRWEYLGYYKDPRGNVTSRTVTLYFEEEKLARIEGLAINGKSKPLDGPEIDRIVNAQQNSALQNQREESEKAQESGVKVEPPK